MSQITIQILRCSACNKTFKAWQGWKNCLCDHCGEVYYFSRGEWLNAKLRPKPRKKREAPREVLARHLTRDHGMHCESEDISWVKGAWSHVTFDVTHRWTAICQHHGKRVEITGIESITKSARYGVTLEKNGPDSPYYGDYSAEPNPFDCKSK